MDQNGGGGALLRGINQCEEELCVCICVHAVQLCRGNLLACRAQGLEMANVPVVGRTILLWEEYSDAKRQQHLCGGILFGGNHLY